jgi:AraC-like DNA-binding protein
MARDFVCNSGPTDRVFEERHEWVSIAVVLSGTFTYGNEFGSTLLTPGSLLLGQVGACFTCGHEHGAGDRCLSFQFEPGLFEKVAAAAGAHSMHFGRNSLPAHRSLTPLVARAFLAVDGGAAPASFEELSLDLAAAALSEGIHRKAASRINKRDERRVAAVARYLEENFAQPCALTDLASVAGLSPYHFLRVFRATTGATPHQHLLRVRLRAAAVSLARTDSPVTQIALASGFDDLSNFIRGFRAEYGVAPSHYRRHRISLEKPATGRRRTSS